MGDLSKMLQGFEENAQKLKEELASKTFSVKSGGGMIELTLNGNGEVIDLIGMLGGMGSFGGAK